MDGTNVEKKQMKCVYQLKRKLNSRHVAVR